MVWTQPHTPPHIAEASLKEALNMDLNKDMQKKLKKWIIRYAKNMGFMGYGVWGGTPPSMGPTDPIYGVGA